MPRRTAGIQHRGLPLVFFSKALLIFRRQIEFSKVEGISVVSEKTDGIYQGQPLGCAKFKRILVVFQLTWQGPAKAGQLQACQGQNPSVIVSSPGFLQAVLYLLLHLAMLGFDQLCEGNVPRISPGFFPSLYKRSTGLLTGNKTLRKFSSLKTQHLHQTSFIW